MKELELIADKKYELLKDDYIKVGERTVYRIRALKDFGNVKKGDLGGYIAKEENLSHDRNAWVFDNAVVVGEGAAVYDDAEIHDNVRVYDRAKVYHDARVYDNAFVDGKSEISGHSRVFESARVEDSNLDTKARVYGRSRVMDSGLRSFSRVYDNAFVNNSTLSGNCEIYGDSTIDNGYIFENAKVYDNAIISGPGAIVAGNVKVCEDCHIVTGTTVTGDNVLTSYRDFVNFKNPYSYNAYTWVKNSNKIYRNDNGLFLFGLQILMKL